MKLYLQRLVLGVNTEARESIARRGVPGGCLLVVSGGRASVERCLAADLRMFEKLVLLHLCLEELERVGRACGWGKQTLHRFVRESDVLG